MNKDVSKNFKYYYPETLLKYINKNMVLYRSPNYEQNIEAWMSFGGDNEQYALLTGLEQMKRSKIFERSF